MERRREDEWEPRRDKNREQRLTREDRVWLEKMAKATKVQYSADEFDDAEDGEQDARGEQAREGAQRTRDQQAHEDGLADFERLSVDCEALEHELDGLVGTGPTPNLPDGTDKQQVTAITKLVSDARAHLHFTRPDDARDLVRQATERVAAAHRAAEERKAELERKAALERQALVGEIEQLAKIFRVMNQLTKDEWRSLEESRKAAKAAVDKGDPNARKLVDGLRGAIDAAITTTDHAVLRQRLEEQINKPSGNAATLSETYKACVEAGVKFESVTERATLRGLGLLPGSKAPTTYKIDGKSSRKHAYDRHTREGIWEAGAVWTAHASSVAIFASVGDLDAALQNAPTAASSWTGGSRVDAEVGGVHYQGIPLGDTVSLTSWYPTNRNYPKAAVDELVKRLIREGADFQAFCTELARLR